MHVSAERLGNEEPVKNTFNFINHELCSTFQITSVGKSKD
jgi:hypothetical protein